MGEPIVPLWYISPSKNEISMKNKSVDSKYMAKYKEMLGVYAAFYHPIPNSVRVVFNMDLSKQSWIRKKAIPKHTFYCAYYGQSGEYLVTVTAKFDTRYLADCPVSEEREIPSNLFFFRNDSLWRPGMNPPWLCPITNLRKRRDEEELKGKLAVCLGSISFPTLNWLLLVQFMEHYKIQGASKVFVFQKVPVDRLTETIIAYYRDQGFVEHKHNPINFSWCPFDPSGNNYDGVFCGRMTFRNYCSLHAAYHFKYVAFVDFDELLSPINTAMKLTDILDFLDDPNKSYGSFIFNSIYHVTREKQVMIEDQVEKPWPDLRNFVSENLPAISWKNTSGIQNGYWPKTVVKPETVDKGLFLFIHVVKTHFPGWEPRNVSSHEGIFHHFKNISQWLKYRLHDKDQEAVGKFTPVDPATYFSYEYFEEMTHQMRQGDVEHLLEGAERFLVAFGNEKEIH